MAYVSDETGRPEVYVRAFPGAGQKQKVSSRGGTQPRWQGDDTLYYLSSDGGRSTIMTARSLDSGVSGRAFDEPQPAYSHERAIYDVPFPSSTGASGYGVVPGGKRFVVLDASQQIEPLTAVTNWPSMLKP